MKTYLPHPETTNDEYVFIYVFVCVLLVLWQFVSLGETNPSGSSSMFRSLILYIKCVITDLYTELLDVYSIN